MGPVTPTRKDPDTLNGPIIAVESIADGHEWDQCFYQEILPIPLNGPIVAAEEYCQWPRMGPVILPRNSADALGWAHYF